MKIGIIGIGLIGGSIAIEVKKTIKNAYIIGYDSSQSNLDISIKLGLIDGVISKKDYKFLDVIFLAMPVKEISRQLPKILDMINSKALVIDFELNYFNSSSAKQFIQLISKLEDEQFEGKVIWKYPNDHIIMYDRGKELEAILDVPFEFIGI